MRAGVRFVACAALVLSVAGCDPLTEQKYVDQGAGVDLYTSDRAGQVELLHQYVDFVCSQAGPSCDPTTFVEAGMNDIDQRCDSFLTWLDARRRDKEPVVAELSAITTAVHSVMTVTGSSPKALDIVTAAFGLASASYTNWNSRLLISIDQSTVQAVVYKGQGDFRAKIIGVAVPDQPTAIYLLRNYLRLCMPTTIEASINITTALVLNDAPKAARNNLVVTTMTRPGPIRDVNAQMQRQVVENNLSSQGEPTDPAIIKSIRTALCIIPPDGTLDLEAHTRLGIYLKSIKQQSSTGNFLAREMVFMHRLIDNNKTADCSLFGST
jgi:hypothetical protein